MLGMGDEGIKAKRSAIADDFCSRARLFKALRHQMGMAKEGRASPDYERRKEGVIYGLLVCALGSIWLAQEIGAIKTGLPIGPIIIIVIGFTMLLPHLKK